MVPGAFSFPPSGSYPVRASLITKPPLQAVTRRVPDFMWLAADSATLYPVLIEIEKPSKRWFRKDGVPTQQFTQAASQLREWRAWFGQRANQLTFMRQFDIPDDFDRGRFHPQYVLIYGRRQEFTDNPHLRAIRAAHQHPDESFATFDRLTPLRAHEHFICIRRRPNWYEAVAVPPTFRNGPMLSDHWTDVRCREEAIQRCEWMCKARKRFLISRLEYWDQWAAVDDKGFMTVGDEE